MVASQASLQQARALVAGIMESARDRDYKTLLKVDAEPRTEVLLDLLPETESRQASVHLRGARIWRSKQNRKAQRKFDAATKAVDELDLVLARGILRKIDWEVLEDSELARYNELLLALEARAVELEEIQNGFGTSTQPPDGRSRRKRFWSR